MSTLTTAHFAAYAAAYQSVAAQAAAAHQQFMQTLGASAQAYGTTETANTASTSLSSELVTILETYINATITAPPQTYLSALVPYLVGIQAASWGISSLPSGSAVASAGPSAAVVDSAGPMRESELAAGLAASRTDSASSPATSGHPSRIVNQPDSRDWTVDRLAETSDQTAIPAAHVDDSGATPEEGYAPSAVPAVPATAPASDDDGALQPAVGRAAVPVIVRSPIGG